MPIVQIDDVNVHSKKIIIADIDETVCDSCQVVSPEMAEQINTMIAKGYIFAFISGTTVPELQRMISSRVTEEHHFLAMTGTNYTRISNGSMETLYNYPFTKEERDHVMNAFAQLIEQYGIETMTTQEDQLQDRGSQITLSALGRGAPSETKAQYDPSGEKRISWLPFLKNLLGDAYQTEVGGTTSINVTRKGSDKEAGIRKFLQHHEYGFDEVLFFGDKLFPNGNDYPAANIVDCVAVKNPEETLEKLRLLP